MPLRARTSNPFPPLHTKTTAWKPLPHVIFCCRQQRSYEKVTLQRWRKHTLYGSVSQTHIKCVWVSRKTRTHTEVNKIGFTKINTINIINLIVAPWIFVESLLLSTEKLHLHNFNTKTLSKLFKSLRHVSILSDHHQGALLFLAKVILQYSQFNSFLQTSFFRNTTRFHSEKYYKRNNSQINK